MPLSRFIFTVSVLLPVACFAEAGLADDFTVETLNAEKVFPGTTLFSVTANFNTQKIIEADMRGKTVWSYPIPDSVKGEKGFLQDVNLLDNGHILFTLHHAGIFEITRAGKVVWSHKDPEASHDADRLANGNTLVSSRDRLYEVTRDGEIVWQVNAPSGGENKRKFHKAIRIGTDGKRYGG
ncbi:MAG: aryl-sulfate sulfotransferase [Rhodospirillales bacterium]